MAPALTGAAILSVIRGMEKSRETPFLLGNPGGVFVLSTEIYRYLRLDTPPEPGNAGALALAILVLTIALMLWQWKYLAGRSYVTVSGRGPGNRPFGLGRWRWPLFALALCYIGLALGVPLLFLLASSFTSVFGVFIAAGPRVVRLLQWCRRLLERGHCGVKRNSFSALPRWILYWSSGGNPLSSFLTTPMESGQVVSLCG